MGNDATTIESKISGRELARILNVSEATIRKSRNSGRIQSYDAENGKYIMPGAADEFNAFRDPSKGREDFQATGGRIDGEAMDGGGDDSTGSYQDNKVRHEAAKARLAELELARRKGEFVPVEDVERQAKKVASTVKRLLMAIPDRISQDLAADADPNSIKLKLDNALRNVLEAIGNETGRIR